jgi:hypothetical protein
MNPKPGSASGGLLASLTASPLGMFLIVAMALGMAGILSRVVMRIASLRRHQVYVDHGEQDWVKSIPPEDAPSIAALPVDLGYAPDERVDRNVNDRDIHDLDVNDLDVNDLDSALRRFMREHERRAA